MYFESNRSSDAGMLAVGTVVMNRLKSGRHGSTVCQVVGQPNQFAPGVLTRPMTDSGKPRAFRMADAVFNGARHTGAGSSMFFHTYGYRYPYNNMRYTLVAGGNAFYEKVQPPKTWYGAKGRWPGPPTPTERVMIAHAEPYNDRSLSSTPREVVAASVRPAPVIRDRPIAVEERVAVARNGVREPEPFDIASNGVDQPMPAGGPDGVPQYEPLPSARPQQRGAASRYERLAQADLPRQAPSRAAEVPQYEPATAQVQPRSTPSRYERLAQAETPRREIPTDVPVYEASAAAMRAPARPAPSRYERVAQAETPRREIQPDVPVYEPEPAPARSQPRVAPSRYERLAQAEMPPATYEPRRERREEPRAVMSRPLAEPVEARPLPAPVAERAPNRVAAREMQDDYDAPRQTAPARRRETPQELGWNAGPQGVPVDDVPTEYVPSAPSRSEAQGFDEPTGATKLRGKNRIVRGY
ncbi:cell wall hydrolase [Hansschlegelia quercus]|uniref:Cell wall hydrolase n=2 Tax=Hansschlegelia quercus TaxID=2528245 RepID=A0A4Q9GDN4_9HYPH|nr:cell wall hydrolase [Hansschlegelia quercus]